MEKGELILYQVDNGGIQLEVKVEEETVWLTQAQMAELFETTRNNVTLHISNVFKEKELIQESVCKDSLLTAKDGKKYKTKFYNLDVIISVGYRVKSQRGTQFRIWATQILKGYLLKGYAVHKRLDRIEHRLTEHDKSFDLLIKTNVLPNEGIFFDGQMFDAYKFTIDLIKKATNSIVLIDNYIDENTLLMLSKRADNVSATIFTARITEQLKLDLEKYNSQYQKIKIEKYTKAHDRFLILDNKDVYHIGASLKDLGRKWFAFSKLNIDHDVILNKLT